ncbi:MAG: tetratricopeptide repeat protein, partial [Comamonas sp.]
MQASQTAAAEVNQLLERGKVNEAAQRVQSHLKKNSNDVQMRFLQGVIAAEQQKFDQAIQIFTALTQEYPGLPEPYNNLAVLYAAKGEERKATQVLEQAIRTNPSYATAHENLGDLYARMASDAYAKALQLDNNRKAIQPKLALIKQIFPGQGAPVVIAAATATPAA